MTNTSSKSTLSPFAREALQALEKAGFTRAVVSFEGGHDEGGASSVIATARDGREKELPLWEDRDVRDADGRPVTVVDPRTGHTTWKQKPPSALGALSELLQRPVETRYGSFAGEFHVSGQVTYDVALQSVQITGSEEFPSTYAVEEDL